MFNRYDSFVILAETLQWDEATIDFAPDKEAWPALDDTENAHVLGLIAGFCIAESAVSGHLGSFQAAASNDLVAACFRAQARDERWHIGFGTRLVQGAALGHDEVEALLTLGQAAAAAWGGLVSPDAAERAVRIHRNRLRSVNMKFF